MVSLGLQHRIPLSCDGCHEAKLSGLKHPLRSPGFPDPREDLESRSPNLGLYTTKGTEPPLRDLLFGSSRGSGLGFRGTCGRSVRFSVEALELHGLGAANQLLGTPNFSFKMPINVWTRKRRERFLVPKANLPILEDPKQ